MKSSPTLFATLALGAAAAAQTVPAPPTEFTSKPIDTISLELSGTPTIKRVVAGTLLADGSQHALILADSQIVFLYQPAFSASVHLLSGAANDLDVAPGVVGGHDGFVTVGSAGLSLYAFDAGSGAFASAVVSNSTKWVNAKRVRAADINATGTVDYVGVGSNSRTIVVRRDVSGVATESEFNPNLEINDLFLMQWDFDSNLEIAVLDTSGIHVYEFTGTTAASYSGNANGAITKFRILGDSRDRIAWLADAGGGVQQLREVSKRNPTPVISIPTMPSTGTALASADSHGAFGIQDGNDELVIMRSENYSPLVLQNLGAGADDADPNFMLDPDPNDPPTVHGYLEGGDPALEEIAGPSRKPVLYKDLGGDGYPDLLIPIIAGSGSQKIEFWRGEKPLSAAPAPTLLSADLSPLTGTPTQRSLTVEVNTNLAEEGHNCVEVILWRQPYGGAPMRTGLVHRYYALPEELGYEEFTIDFEVAQSGDCFSPISSMPNVFWLEVRFAYQASGVISNPSDSSIAFLCTDLDTVDALTNYPEPPLGNLCLPSTMAPNGSACELRDDLDACLNSIGNTLIRTPSLVKRLRIPPSGNSIPQPGQLNAGSWNLP